MPATENNTHVIQVLDLKKMLNERRDYERIKVSLESCDRQTSRVNDLLNEAYDALNKPGRERDETIAAMSLISDAISKLEAIDESRLDTFYINRLATLKNGDLAIECV